MIVIDGTLQNTKEIEMLADDLFLVFAKKVDFELTMHIVKIALAEMTKRYKKRVKNANSSVKIQPARVEKAAKETGYDVETVMKILKSYMSGSQISFVDRVKILSMTYEKGMNHQEAAAALGIKEKLYKDRLASARVEFKRDLSSIFERGGKFFYLVQAIDKEWVYWRKLLTEEEIQDIFESMSSLHSDALTHHYVQELKIDAQLHKDAFAEFTKRLSRYLKNRT